MWFMRMARQCSRTSSQKWEGQEKSSDRPRTGLNEFESITAQTSGSYSGTDVYVAIPVFSRYLGPARSTEKSLFRLHLHGLVHGDQLGRAGVVPGIRSLHTEALRGSRDNIHVWTAAVLLHGDVAIGA